MRLILALTGLVALSSTACGPNLKALEIRQANQAKARGDYVTAAEHLKRACAFDLEDGPVRVSTKTNALFQSLSFHARGGSVFFAVTDRAAVRGERPESVRLAR